MDVTGKYITSPGAVYELTECDSNSDMAMTRQVYGNEVACYAIFYLCDFAGDMIYANLDDAIIAAKAAAKRQEARDRDRADLLAKEIEAIANATAAKVTLVIEPIRPWWKRIFSIGGK